MKKIFTVLVTLFIFLSFNNVTHAQVTYSESFDSPTFPPTGWTDSIGSGTVNWAYYTTTIYPSGYYPHSGLGMAGYNCYAAPSGYWAILNTPPFTLIGRGSSPDSVVFWFFRGNAYSAYADSISVYVNTAPNLEGSTNLGSILVYNGLTPDWYRFAYAIPASFNGPTNYIIFKAVSAYYNDIFIDDVQWTAYPPAGNMGYYSSNTVQLNAAIPILPGSLSNQIVQVQISDTGNQNPFIINRLKFETTGSNNPSVDILNAKLYYTRSVNTFGTVRQYGSTVSGPNGVFNFTDTATLDPNVTNYFWLTYDLNSGAAWPDSVDAQCDSIIGTSPMGGVVPTTVAPAGSSPIDVYCRGTVNTATCGTNMYIGNVTFGSINNTTGCNGNLPYDYTPYSNLTTTVRQNNQYPISCAVTAYSNPTLFGIWVDWNNNNSFAEVNEYTQTTPVTSALTNPGTGTVMVPSGATLGNHRMRVRSSYTLSLPVTQGGYCSAVAYGEQEDYVVNVLPDTNMYYTSSTTTQSSNANIYSPSNNTQIIGMQVVTAGTISPINATSFTLNTTGTSHPNLDITSAKLFWTGLSPEFSTSNLFGLAVQPNGTYSITGSQTLIQGVNYFWLTYDIPSTAMSGDTVDAQCTSITVGGVARTPSVTSPAGFRIIQGNALCGTYNIPGDYPSIAAAITDLNSKSSPNCAVVYNVAAGWREVASNLTITTTGTTAGTITFQKSGTGANPKIVAGTGTGTYDGIIKLYGVNYITFDGIDVSDTSSNTTTTTQMEWGYALLRFDGTHGCQNITIKNCNISLIKTNTATYGIYSYNRNLTGGTVTPTAPSGSNSNNSFLSNNISSSYNGMVIYGYLDSSPPFALEDHDNTVSTIGNGRSSITNFGGASTSAYGIYAYYQSNPTISNTYINSRGGVNSTGYLYGIYSYNYYNAGNSTITGDTITLVDTSTSTGYQYAIYNATYYGHQVNISNNVVQDCVNPCASYYSYYIYNASGALNYLNSINISNNKLINNKHGVAGSTTTYTYDFYNGGSCATSINMSNNLDSGNVIYGTTAYRGYLMYNGGATLNCTMNNNRIVNDTISGTGAATGTIYGVYTSTGGYNSTMIDSNVVMNNVQPTTSSSTFYMTYCPSPANSVDYSYNTVSGNIGTGTGTFYCMYYSASPYYGSTVNITNNTITNNQKLTSTGTGVIYGIYHGGSGQGVININNNTVTGLSSAASSTIYGISQAGSPPNWLNINNNIVGNISNAGTSTIYGIYNVFSSTTTQPTMTGDSVFNITGMGGSVYGMYVGSSISYGNPIVINNNRISGITSNTGTTGYVYGLYLNGGVVDYVYNNMISDLNAPASTNYSIPAVSGMYINAGNSVNVYYNTILLKAASTSSTTFGTAAIYASTTSNLDLRNNIAIDSSTPGSTGGYACAYRRSSTTLTTYLTSSNNNCFYAGTPAANHLIFYDGSNSKQTLSDYKAFVISRDLNSATEYPPFVNNISVPYDLRIKTNVGTQMESGGQIISTTGFPVAPINITQDAFGTARYPNIGYPVGSFTPVAPDIGANEFGGLNADLVAPFISYTPLGTGGTSNRPFNNVIITDASGVNTTAGTKPRCYYKRSTDANTINDNTDTTDGWKYVEANGTTSPFDFTIDYSLLNGGTGVSTGNVVQYFVIAQDLASTPNVGSNQSTFTVAPTTVALAAANTPISNTLSYTIGTGTFAGTYQVGTSETYTSLTGAGGIFSAINAGTVSGDLTIQITSNTVEDGTNALNLTNETGVGGYKIRIVPSSATMYVLSGSSSNISGMIRLNGAKRVTIDGNNGLGAGKYLTFSNLYGSTPTIGLVSDAIRDSIKYCYIESNNIGTTSGTILFGSGLTWGNDSNTVAYCDIKDTSGYNTPANAIISNGSTTNLQMYNNYNTITNCNIYNWFYDGGAYTAGIYLNTGSANWTISNNSIYQTTSRAVNNSSTFVGIFNNNVTAYDINVTNNYIGGSAPNCGGNAMTYSGPGFYNFYCMYLYVGGLAPSSVQGNTIQNMNLTTSPASGSSTFFRGIWAGYTYSWVNIGNIAGNTIGAATGNGSITLTTNTTTSAYNIYLIYHAGFGTIMNNTIGSITLAGNSSGSNDAIYGIYFYNGSVYGQTFTISNNMIGSLTTANSISLTNNSDFGQSCHGILTGLPYGSICNITNNIVANITSYNNSADYISYVYGIRFNYYSSYDMTVNITGNTVRNLTVNTNYPSASFVLGGILSYNYYGPSTISQNNVYSLYSNGTGGATVTCGIQNRGYTGGPISRNKVYDFRMLGSGSIAPTPNLIGINMTDYGIFPVSNNMVSLTNGDLSGELLVEKNKSNNEKFQQVFVKNPPINVSKLPKEIQKAHGNAIVNGSPNGNMEYRTIAPLNTAPEGSKQQNVSKVQGKLNKKTGPNEPSSTISCGIAGIYYSGTTYSSPSLIYYNTIYIGGSQPVSSSTISWNFIRTSTSLSYLRNNFFVNSRIGGTNFCISNEGSLVSGWPITASNYNVFLCSSDATIGEWGAGNALTMTGWTGATGGDNQSWSSNTGSINPANLLTNISTCDLSINTNNSSAWILSGKGIALDGYDVDFAGDPRVTSISSGVTDIGADEFAATPPSNPVATQVGTPGAGATSTYWLYGRKICSIDWGLGGTSYPSSMTVNYYSGINPPNTSTLGPNYGKSYWTVVPSGSLAGTTYNVTFYFGDNETYSITSPSINTILASSNNTYWQAFPPGGAPRQSHLDWGALTLSPTLLNILSFSTYALADGSLTPSLTYPAYGALDMPTTDTLIWTSVFGVSTYHVQVSTDSTFATGLVVNDSTVSGTSRIVTGLNNQVNYFWRVKAKFGAYNGPWVAPYKFRTSSGVALVALKVIPGGFYDMSSGQLNLRDTVQMYLVDSVTCLRVDSARLVIDSLAFTSTASYTNAPSGKYYLYIYHRNHLTISSMYTQNVIRGSQVSYDFTTDSTKAYGYNMIKVSSSPVLWGMIPGDANQDGYVDGLDQTIWLGQNGLNGYFSADFNGDTYVDGLDQTIWLKYNGYSTALPCYFALVQPSSRFIKNVQGNNTIRVIIPNNNKNINK